MNIECPMQNDEVKGNSEDNYRCISIFDIQYSKFAGSELKYSI
jgi:hypothetical protein